MDDNRQLRPIDGAAYLADRARWVVADDHDCDHGGALDHLGSDGVNEYYQCRRCEAIVVTAPL